MARRGDRLRGLLRSPRETDRVAAAERIQAVLAAEGSVARAARRLGVSESTIRRRARGPTRPRTTSSYRLGAAARRPTVAGAATRATAGAPATATATATRNPEAHGARIRLVIVLHTHLPWVLHHGTWPHGEEWLLEAACFAYLPLLAMLRRRKVSGARHQLTITVSPVLAAQLASARLRARLPAWLAERREAALRATDQRLAPWWVERFDEVAAIWRELEGDLVGALAALADAGTIELGSCAATHAYLPLAADAASVAIQVALARAAHRELFGADPAGLWLPECGYRPAGPWRHPLTGCHEAFRPGLENELEHHGFRWTVLDAHLLDGVPPTDPYGEEDRVAEPHAARTDLTPRLIGRSRVAALLRDGPLSLTVWSRERGFPGDARHLDFHKRHWPSGLRLWRVTDPRGDLGAKAPYAPDDALVAVDEQASRFLALVARRAEDDTPVVVPFDAELFGHWWFEGVAWLEKVLAGAHATVEVTTPSRELATRPPWRRAAFREGSWGAGGDHRTWANPDTAWMAQDLEALERPARAAVSAARDGAWRTAVASQLLLLQASDWPFHVTTGAARDYAEHRFRTHRDRLRELLAGPEQPMPRWAEEDAPFTASMLAHVWGALT